MRGMAAGASALGLAPAQSRHDSNATWLADFLGNGGGCLSLPRPVTDPPQQVPVDFHDEVAHAGESMGALASRVKSWCG